MDVFNIKINVFDTFSKKVISRTAMVGMGVLAKNEREGRCVLGESIFQQREVCDEVYAQLRCEEKLCIEAKLYGIQGVLKPRVDNVG